MRTNFIRNIWFSFLSLSLCSVVNRLSVFGKIPLSVETRGQKFAPFKNQRNRDILNVRVIKVCGGCDRWRKKEMQAGRQVLDDRSNAARIGTDFSNPNPPPSITSHHPFRSILIISRAHHDSRHFTTAFNYYPGEWVRCDEAAAPAKYRSSSLFRAVAAGSRWNRVVEDKLGKKVAINYLVRRRRIYI